MAKNRVSSRKNTGLLNHAKAIAAAFLLFSTFSLAEDSSQPEPPNLLFFTPKTLATARSNYKNQSVPNRNAGPRTSKLKAIIERVNTANVTVCLDSGAPKLKTADCRQSDSRPFYDYEYQQAVGDGNPENWARGVGNAAALLAFGILMESEDGHLSGSGASMLQAARRLLAASAQYKLWGAPASEKRLDQKACMAGPDLAQSVVYTEVPDLASAHLLIGLSILYDWVPLSEGEKSSLREALLAHGRQMFCLVNSPGAQAHEQYLNNHMWITNTALATVGYALRKSGSADVQAEVQRWTELAKSNYDKIADSLNRDGSDLEGPLYWDYGVPFLVRYVDLLRSQENVDLTRRHSGLQKYFEKAANFRASLTMNWSEVKKRYPEAIGDSVNLADANRVSVPAIHVLRRFARDYRLPAIQGLADRMDALVNGMGGFDYWMNFIWYDPGLFSAPMNRTGSVFSLLGLTSIRNSWAQRGSASLLAFQAGPPMGDAFVESSCSQDRGVGHAHPAAGSFSLSFALLDQAYGAYIVGNPGYTNKLTRRENTLTVDGEGQYGEGSDWLSWSDREGRKGACHSSPQLRFTGGESGPLSGVSIQSGDLTKAYDPAKGISSFIRTLVFFKSLNVLLVVDQIKPDKAVSKYKDFELRFHTDHLPIPQPDGALTWADTHGSETLNFRWASLVNEKNDKRAAGATAVGLSETYPQGTHDNKSENVILVRRATSLGDWIHVAAISWGTTLTPVRFDVVQGSRSLLQVGKRRYEIHLAGGSAEEFLKPLPSN